MFLSNHINYQGSDDTTAIPSSNIWFDCPDPTQAAVFGDDFLGFASIADTAVGVNGWHAILDTSVTAAPLATEVGGVARILTSGTDNDFGHIISNGNVGNICKVSSSTKKKVWFEARVRLNDVAEQTAFVGLMEGGANADDLFETDGTGIEAEDFIGFQVLEADEDAWQTGYNDGAAGQGTVHNVNAVTFTAAQWVKLGIKFDGKAVYFYVNGAIVAPTTAGGAQDGIGILANATDMPDGEELAVLLGITSKAGTVTPSLDVDWVYCAQER